MKWLKPIRGMGLTVLMILAGEADATDRQQVVERFVAAAQRSPNAAAGEALWSRDGVQGRRCASCHGRDLTRPGHHQRTGKVILPMAPSVNPQRYTDRVKVAKWLKRNCKWTYGRECTAGEKADLLAWLSRL